VYRQLGVVLDGVDPAEQDQPAFVAGKGERLPGLDDAARGDPPVGPDQGAGLVVAAPDGVRVRGRDAVPAPGAEQTSEDGLAVPVGCAEPDDVADRIDQSAPVPVGDQRVLA